MKYLLLEEQTKLLLLFNETDHNETDARLDKSVSRNKLHRKYPKSDPKIAWHAFPHTVHERASGAVPGVFG